MSRRAGAVRRGLPTATAGIAVPLDKRFRRPDIRPGTRRLGRLVFRTALTGVLLAALGIAGVWAVARAADSPLFAVTRIDVTGNHRLSAAEVQGLVSGLRGESILRADFEVYRKRVMDSPWVAGVSLWRYLPSTVEVRVVERVPLAIARLHEQLYLVDTTGMIIDQFGPAYADLDLPIVDGLMRAPARGAALVDADRLALAARLLDALSARRDLAAHVSQIAVTDAHDAVVLLTDDAVQLHLGDERFIERLTTYFDIQPTLLERFAALEYVDLRFDDRVYVKAGGGMKKVERP
jgi:cell division protein FtsQ